LSAVLNDILAGKPATPETADPYRSPGPGLICTQCRREFPPAQAMNGLCRACAQSQPDALARMLHEQEIDARNRAAINDEIRRRNRNATIFRGVIIVAIVILAGLFRYGMRKQMDEDDRQMRGIKSYESDTP
jgi:hypothetical protein